MSTISSSPLQTATSPCAMPWTGNASTTPLFTQLFEAQVLKNPHAIAVVFEGVETTYETLNRRANQLANYLVANGFQREDRIGICLDRSTDAITAMLGILKAGCAFVPLDPEFPQDRLAYIVDHASIRWVLCDPKYRSLYREKEDETQVLNISSPEFWSGSSENLSLDIPSNSLAYVMYTSGSTGKPKGVQVEHESLTTYCLADIEVYELNSEDRTLQFSTLNFDVAIEEIYPPLLVGSTVVVRPRERAEAQIELSHWIESEKVTALHIATAYWNEWVDLMAASHARVPQSLRLVIVTGEKISVEHYRRWQSLCDHQLLWCNAYGPTETTVTCTVFIPDVGWQGTQMPIGKPLPGYSAHILDESLQPVEKNETGHLFIAGPALARGYLDRPDLTEKAFVVTTLPEDSEPTRLYRTGDLARWLEDGNIEFSGRVDHQMKIGSYRIEPGEIEAVIHQEPRVRESLVVCEEKQGQKYLVAYVVRNDARWNATELANFLRERLPQYMVPSRYVFLDSMPKTINGKIDRARLPSSETAEVARETGKENREATTDLEKDLVRIWADVLNLPSVGVQDDFFFLGGSSLLVTRVIARIASQLQEAIPVRDFFANPTVESLARHLEHLRGGARLAAHATYSWSKSQRERLPEIRPIEVSNGTVTLTGIHYPSVQQLSESRNHTVLFAPSYGHEYTRAHRNMQQLAIQLAQRGFDVVRFDLSGTGDSLGDASHRSWKQWISDIHAMDRFASTQWIGNSITWIGVRLGALLLSECDLNSLGRKIYWDPVVSGKDYLESLSRFHRYEQRSLTKFLVVSESESTEMMGYDWPDPLVDQLRQRSFRPQNDREACLVVTRGQNLTDGNFAGLTIRTDDDVLWNEYKYINSAFASPGVFKSIFSILENPMTPLNTRGVC